MNEQIITNIYFPIYDTMHNHDEQYRSAYDTLGLKPPSTSNEIKKTFKKLSIKYHPDKCFDDGATERYVKIKSAYELLIAKYDDGNDNNDDNDDNIGNGHNNLFNQTNIYEVLTEYLHRRAPKFSKYVEQLLDDIYENDQYKNDINHLRLDKIFDKIIIKASKLSQPVNIPIVTDLDIIHTIECQKEDRDSGKYAQVIITRQTRNKIIVHVPLKLDTITYYNEGEMNKNNNYGNLIINVFVAI